MRPGTIPGLPIRGSALCAVIDPQNRCHQALPAGAAHNPALFIRVGRFHPCWLTCSCITRSTCGWRGSSRVSGSNAMRMTRSCIVSAERQARQVRAALEDRMVEVGLQLHPDKTRIVYCKDGKRRGLRAHVVYVPWATRFGRAGRAAKNGCMFVVVLARDQQGRLEEDRAGGAVSWRLHRRTGRNLRRSRTDGSIRSCGAGCSTTVRSTASALFRS